MAIKSVLETITPDRARELLKLNIRNRPIRPNFVNELAAEMEAGRWKVTNNAIGLGDGILIDGQHRLAACVQSNCSFQTLVTTGLSADSFEIIDTGKRRSKADTLALLGEKNCHRLAATLALVDRYLSGQLQESSPNGRCRAVNYSNTDIQRLLVQYPDVRKFICHKCERLMTPALSAGCRYLFSVSNEAKAADFFDKLAGGHGLEQGHPVHVLRELLIRNSLAKAKLGDTYIFAVTIKAWNAFKAGHTISKLFWRNTGDSPEKFPLIS